MDVQKVKADAHLDILVQHSATVACLFLSPISLLVLLFGGLLLSLPLCALWVVLFVYGSLPVKVIADEANSDDRSMRERSSSFAKSLEEQPQAFLSDQTVGTSLVCRTLKFISYNFSLYFHDFEIEGLDNLPPKGKGALLIAMHATHNVDIPLGITGLHEKTGRAPRGLIHRGLFAFHPYFKYWGLIPGQRHTAKHLLQHGFLVAVLPGGAEEALTGHENAYVLHPRWRDRRGFAHVAQDAGVDIIPMFMKNVEEMRFNFFFFLGNRFGLTHRFQNLVDARIPGVSFVLKQLGFLIWWTLAYTGIPVPVKLTMFVGKPIRVGKEDSVDDVAEQSRLALQAMMAEKQPYGHEYMPGLRERFARLKSN